MYNLFDGMENVASQIHGGGKIIIVDIDKNEIYFTLENTLISSCDHKLCIWELNTWKLLKTINFEGLLDQIVIN